MKKTTLLCSLFLLFGAASNHSFFFKKNDNNWQPDAGVVPSYTDGASLTASSNGAEAWKVIDGNFETAWQSGAPLPQGFLINKKQNFLLEQDCFLQKQGRSIGHQAVDGNLNTSVNVPAKPAVISVHSNQLIGTNGAALLLKCQATEPIHIYGIGEGECRILIGEYLPAENFGFKKIVLPKRELIHTFQLQSDKDFQLFEIAGFSEPIIESVTIDFGKIQSVGTILTRHWAGVETAISTKVYLSENGKQWDMAAQLDPAAEHPVLTKLDTEVPARYLMIEQELRPKDWNKVFLWEVKAFDKYGPYGPRPNANVGAVNLRELLGVNGYWSWGTNICSADLPKGEGPGRYAPMSSHARNYHDMTWDLKSPGQSIDFSKMETEGTPSKAWLRWDREYEVWTDAGLNIQASLQFHNFNPEDWKNPEADGFAYAKSFVEHFGLNAGNGLVCSVEAGNEPWKYPADLYQKILLGMAKGAKMADPTMEVFPCALQAVDPSAEQTDIFKNYIGARITKETADLLDGINIHAYSYLTGKNGQRKAIFPEHPESTFWEILNAIRWRNVNMPGKKIYLSEWGWDADGAGEDCTHDVCVSEQAASNYAVRAALIAARLGINRATWFFYANAEQPSSLYTRSGLTASIKQDFKKKKAFHALHALVNLAGGSYFHRIIREDESAWAYMLADVSGNPTHLILWRPIDGNDTSEKDITVKINVEIISAVLLDGSGPNGRKLALPKKIKGAYLIKASATPTLFELAK